MKVKIGNNYIETKYTLRYPSGISIDTFVTFNIYKWFPWWSEIELIADGIKLLVRPWSKEIKLMNLNKLSIQKY